MKYCDVHASDRLDSCSEQPIFPSSGKSLTSFYVAVDALQRLRG